jgi:cation diffusion facilitator CzcD-associated flavoprotein CzcO
MVRPPIHGSSSQLDSAGTTRGTLPRHAAHRLVEEFTSSPGTRTSMSTASQDSTDALEGFDSDAMRERYRVEREKRLRADGNAQYIEVKAEFAHFVEDPYIEEEVVRDPCFDEMDVLIVGGGFGGLQAGARLREAGVEDIRIVEKGGDFGGTWYWNRYPGAQCDVEAYIYLPLLEETGYMPQEKYAYAKEILAHSRAIGEHYGLYEGSLFQTEVTAMRWDDGRKRWLVSTNRGDELAARFVAMANGPLHRPKLPGIQGINDFKGHTLHTSRWDYDYTGGGPDGGLDRLADKRVAVIGTGATAIQCVPFVGETAKQLYVFQRTPSSVDLRGNSPTDPTWAESLKPGWQKERMENFNALVSGVPQPEDLVDDGWTDLIGKMVRRFREAAKASKESDNAAGDIRKIMEMANFEKMNEIRDRVDDLVNDSEVAENLKPYYQMFCKRPCFNDEFLPTFNRPTVELIDTDGKGVDRISENGVVVKGVEYEVDCIIFATGFEVGTSYTRRAGYDVYGREGVSLSERWGEGMRTLHGMHSHCFPNCFVISANQGGFTANYPHLLDEASTHIAYIVSHALQNDFRSVEATEAAEAEWVETILANGNGTTIGGPGCTPGYYNNEGQPHPTARQGVPYGKGSIRFFELLEEWREEGSFAGLALER